jgi:hypothetical protein
MHVKRKLNFKDMGFDVKKRTCIIPTCVENDKKHWNDNLGWTMAKLMHQILIKVIKIAIQTIYYIALSSMMKFLQLTTNYGKWC